MIDDEKEVRFFTYALVIAINIFTISLGVYLVGDNLASIRGGDFPKEHELQYSEGLLRARYVRLAKGRNSSREILLVSLSGQKSTKKPFSYIYYCNYDAKHSPNSSFCPKHKELLDNANKPAKIGWYVSKPFLWYNNPYPQMVTLDVEGQSLLSYEESKTIIKKKRKGDIIFNVILNTFMIVYLFFSCLYPWTIIYPVQIRKFLRWLFIMKDDK